MAEDHSYMVEEHAYMAEERCYKAEGSSYLAEVRGYMMHWFSGHYYCLQRPREAQTLWTNRSTAYGSRNEL